MFVVIFWPRHSLIPQIATYTVFMNTFPAYRIQRNLCIWNGTGHTVGMGQSYSLFSSHWDGGIEILQFSGRSIVSVDRARPNLKGVQIVSGDWRLFWCDGENTIFWDMTPCNMDIFYNLMGGPICLWTESTPNLKGILGVSGDWRLFYCDGEDTVFWDMTPCNMEMVYRRFREIAFVVYLLMLKSYVNTTHKHTKTSFKIENPLASDYSCVHVYTLKTVIAGNATSRGNAI